MRNEIIKMTNRGYLKIILGCMYSGKTSKLISIYKHNRIAEVPTCIINYEGDTRYDPELLCSHDGNKIPCIKVKKLLEKQNLSFSQPKSISVIFFPVFFINDEMQDFENNSFYKEWMKVEIKNELINYILPIEDLDDLSNLNEMKNRIEETDKTKKLYIKYIARFKKLKGID